MKVQIQSLHFDADKKLLDLIEDKVSSLQHLLDTIIGSRVVLKIEKSKTADNKVVEIRLEIKGNDLFAKRNSTSFEEATEECIMALRNQIKKHKDKIKR